MTDKHHTFTLPIEKTFTNEIELYNIIRQIVTDSNLFDLPNGRVFHCQILRKQKSDNQNHETGIITNSDILIIAFHHVAYDLSTSQIFLNELRDAYNSSEPWSENEKSLQYIDYSIHERAMDMTTSREFWHLQFEGYNLERRLPLPVDRHRLSTDQRSGTASVAEISFDDDTSTAFFNYASSHQVTLFQLGLATFYAFLFKLTHGENDLCVSCFNANRYRTELHNMIGMFVATLPHRLQLDPQWSFDELAKRTREKCLPIFEHSRYPIQHILTDFHLNQSNVSFLETIFDFITLSSNKDQLSFDGASLEQVPLEQSAEVAKFDFMLRFVYNSKLNDGKLSCRFICSRDLFDEETTSTISRRFKHLFEQIFSSNPADIRIDTRLTPLKNLNLLLPEEATEFQGRIFVQQSNVGNIGLFIYLRAFDV